MQRQPAVNPWHNWRTNQQFRRMVCVHFRKEGVNENTQCLSDSVIGAWVRLAEHLADLHDMAVDEAGKQAG